FDPGREPQSLLDAAGVSNLRDWGRGGRHEVDEVHLDRTGCRGVAGRTRPRPGAAPPAVLPNLHPAAGKRGHLKLSDRRRINAAFADPTRTLAHGRSGGRWRGVSGDGPGAGTPGAGGRTVCSAASTG